MKILKLFKLILTLVGIAISNNVLGNDCVGNPYLDGYSYNCSPLLLETPVITLTSSPIYVLSGNAINSSNGSAIYANFNSFISNSGIINSTNRSTIEVNVLLGSLVNNYGALISSTYSGAGSDGIGQDGGSISTFSNFGSVIPGVSGFGINSIPITTLNNLQGAGSYYTPIGGSRTLSGPLTLSGLLPTNYNIIINSLTSFGRLAVSSGSGTTTFGIYPGSAVTNGTYTSVVSGVTSDNLTLTSGTYGVGSWLLSNSSGSIWDLILSGYASLPTGPSTADTQRSLVNTASALEGTYALQNAVLSNSFSYDCALFDANNVCVSAGGRNTAVAAANGLNNTSGLLIAAYRPYPNYRIGAYADQNPSVNNAGSTVNLGSNTTLIGFFGVWNEHLDGTGAEVKVSAAYGQKNITITRAVVGTSEAGSGSSQLNSQGAQAIAKYGFSVADNIIVSPYVGIRYTQNNMGGYTEGGSNMVTAPLTYSALNVNVTTAFAGVGASYKFIPQAMAFASAGVEIDTDASFSAYSATGVSGLTPFNFNTNQVKTRSTAMVGAYYDFVKNQRLGVTAIYRQEPYQAVSTTNVMAIYTVGF